MVHHFQHKKAFRDAERAKKQQEKEELKRKKEKEKAKLQEERAEKKQQQEYERAKKRTMQEAKRSAKPGQCLKVMATRTWLPALSCFYFLWYFNL